ncbi:MAG: helix-turn-helix domain-containing protein [Candidatus Sericytochromatia bacterium]|nr:helix-turn-helix domain-containing protein [Candidatus Sericytochromatia bacterium]
MARHRIKPVKRTLFSQRLSFLRKEAGLTMAALGQKIDVTTSYISLLEAGDRHPSKDLVLRLAEVFFGRDNLAAAEELLGLAGIQPMPPEDQLSPQQIYERALCQNPDDFHSFSGLIRTLIRQQALKEAENRILDGMKRFRDAWRLQALMAQLQLSLENYAMAAAAQHKALEMYTQRRAAQLVLEDGAEAGEGEEEQADLYTNLGVVYFLWGMQAFQRRNQAAAEGQTSPQKSAAASQVADTSALYQVSSEAQTEAVQQAEAECRERFTAAQSAYQQALALSPDDIFLKDEYARICFNIADLSPEAEQPERWRAVIDELSAVLCAPDVAVLGLAHVREASVFLAHAHTKAGRFDEAHHLLSVLQACHPNEWLAHYARICFYSLRAQSHQGLKPAKAAKKAIQSDLDQGLVALEHALGLPTPANQTLEQAAADQDLAFLRQQRSKPFMALLKAKEKARERQS